ncbi:MAG TPA: hypothetical protein VM452_16460 [Caulifigura sp.]|nr:hypothetical protein [Caulifigura sp.]
MSPLRWTWVQRLFGIDGNEIPAGSDVRLTWANLPQSWRVFALLLVVGLAVYAVLRMYRSDASRLPVRGRRLLAGLRISAILLLALMALGPSLGYSHRHVLEPTIVVLRDSSQSMATQDGARDSLERAALGQGENSTARPSRADAVNTLLTPRNDSLLDGLVSRGRLRVLDFAESVQPVAVAESKEPAKTSAPDLDARPIPAIAPLAATGVGTNLHRALTEALSERLSAGIVILTDGQQTDRASGKDELLALARRAAARGTPIFVVGMGDPNRPQNVRVADVFAADRVWKDDPFELQGSIESEGLGGRTVQIELIEQRRDEGSDQLSDGKVLETREVMLPAAGGPSRLTFSHTSKEAGRFAYSLRVPPLEGESSADDNRSTAPAEVKVIDDKARVLVVSGTPNWDYRFLRQILEREKSIDVSCWLQSLEENRGQEGDISITKLPRTREELFNYDVIVLLDPNPNEFDEAWIDLLKDFVREHSGGLLYMAGPSYTSRFLAGPRTEKVRELLPVRFGDVAAIDVESLLQSEDRDWPLGIVERGLDHPLMRFYPELNRSLDAWKLFPGIIWSYPVREAIPAATVLLEHTDPALNQTFGPRPLLVSGQFGSGRTVFAGFDGTWRWRQAGRNAEFFNRFWLQTIRFLVEGRSVEGKRRGSIETDRSRYEVGDRIVVVARLLDPAFKPLEVPQVNAVLESPAGEKLPVILRPTPDQPGRFEAIATARATGRHLLRVELEDAVAGTKIETALSVVPPSLETARTWQDADLLKEIASASQGSYYTVASARDLVEKIPDKRQTITVQGKPQPLWDTGFMLLLVATLLIVEWALRKRYKLL